MDIDKNYKWYNKEFGKFGLGIIFIVGYIASKFILEGYTDLFIWNSIWYSLIVISALAADMFENIQTWIYTSLGIVDNPNISKEDRVSMIKNQLQIAVDRYLSVFLAANGIEKLSKRFFKNIQKITKGVITIKEAIILFSYLVYDLFLKQGGILEGTEYDVALLWVILFLTKMVDAKHGVAGLIAGMYNEAKDIVNVEDTLHKITGHIKELAHLYHIETIPKSGST